MLFDLRLRAEVTIYVNKRRTPSSHSHVVGPAAVSRPYNCPIINSPCYFFSRLKIDTIACFRFSTLPTSGEPPWSQPSASAARPG